MDIFGYFNLYRTFYLVFPELIVLFSIINLYVSAFILVILI